MRGPAGTPLGSNTDMSAELSGVIVASIEAVHARQILDSRGNPTVEVEVDLDEHVEEFMPAVGTVKSQ